jgi:hypothetical protein
VPKFEKAVVRIAELAKDTEILDGYDFNDCDIWGPAVLAVLDNNTLMNSGFDGDFDSILWEVPSTRKRVVGAVGVQNCKFIGCRFHRIGFAGPAEFVVKFREGTSERPSVTSRPQSGPRPKR